MALANTSRQPFIVHPTKIKRLIFHEDFIAICAPAPDPLCAAALLSILTYWTEFKIAIGDSAWIYKSQPELQKDIFGLFGLNKVQANMTWLIEIEYLFQRLNPQNKWDKRYQYQVNQDAVQDAINVWNGLNTDALELNDRSLKTKASNIIELNDRSSETIASNHMELNDRSSETIASNHMELNDLYKNLTTEETLEETLFNSDSESTVTVPAVGENWDKEETSDDEEPTSLSGISDTIYQPTGKKDPLVDDLDSVITLSRIEEEIPNWNKRAKFAYVGNGRKSNKAAGISRVVKSDIAKVVFKKTAVGTFEERILRSEKVRSLLSDLHGKILVVDEEDEIEDYGQLLVRLAALAADDKLPPPPESRKQKIITAIAIQLARDSRLDWDKIEGDEQLSFTKKAGGIWKRELIEMDEITAITVENFEQFVKDYRLGRLMTNGRRGTYFPQAEGKLSYWYGVWKARQRGDSTLPSEWGRGVEAGVDHQVDDHRHGNPDDPELDAKLLAMNPNYFKDAKIDWQAFAEDDDEA